MIYQYLIGDIDFFALHDSFTDPLEYFIGNIGSVLDYLNICLGLIPIA